jgi:predicted O-linked N-acetylglucosamine transferase (SPINDLY family)
MSLQTEAYAYFTSQNYSEAEKIYFQLANSFPSDKDNYWYLGLSVLLQGKSDEFQIIWAAITDNLEPNEIDQTIKLSQILEEEAARVNALGLYKEAVSIRYCYLDLDHHDLSNLIEIVLLLIKLERLTTIEIERLQFFEIIQSGEFIPLDQSILLDFLEKILTVVDINPILLQIAESLCKAHIQYQPKITEKLLSISHLLSTDLNKSIEVLEMAARIDDQNLEIQLYLIDFHLRKTDSEAGISIAKDLYKVSLSRRSVDKLIACHWLIKALLYKSNSWEEAFQINQDYEIHAQAFVSEGDFQKNISLKEASYYLMAIGFHYPYFYDQPQVAHSLRQAVHQLASLRIISEFQKTVDDCKKRLAIRKKSYISERPIRVGYISSCLRNHSVGHLARWLIKYHDRDKFEFYGYIGEHKYNDNLRDWYKQQFYKVYTDSFQSGLKLANEIQKDGIDILIDLDSLTFPQGCGVSVLKPCPLQVTWLGWDAAGLDNVDYFIADPYVLPDAAQEYYLEKIWRLPETYIAVDGFESSFPTARRDLLDIPSDAVVYFSAQNSIKRHPDTVKLQMQILKQVPNSYLILKSMGDQDSLQDLFFTIAEVEGIGADRLRFLPLTRTEAEHRANLAIADVILDTYPYNGATHTLETLWMEIPMVTRVGEQFAARNSYTMMVNAGLTEGIAWTDEEYVEWGIKLGTDQNLRQQVAWKLKQGKQTAPLWNSRQFTRDMETAYEQMWQIWLNSEDDDIAIDPMVDRDLFIAEAELRNQDAIRLAQKGKTSEAIACWQVAISLYPEYLDAHYNLGIAQFELGNLDQAIDSFQTTIQLDPNHANALYNLGLTFVKQNQLDQAIAVYDQALEINPEDIDIPIALGSAFFKQGDWESSILAYQTALEINPASALALSGLGAALTEYGELDEAIACLQSAINIDSNYAQSYGNLGYAFARNNQMEDAVFCYYKALKLNPAFGHAFWNFNNDVLADITNPLHHNFPLRRQLADQFLESCYETDKICSLVNFITNYSNSGLNDIAITKLPELEEFIFENSDDLDSFNVEVLYNSFLFNLNSLRDSRELNINLSKHIGRLYKERVINSKSALYDIDKISNLTVSPNPSPLRIGFLSPHFGRHPVGWCSFDVIRELSQITPHIYLYTTGTLKPDQLTQQFEAVAEQHFWYEDTKFNFDGRVNQLIADISQCQLDVIIDLDSVTVPLGTHILCREHLAQVRISWLGFDAPFVSSDNYWLGDRFTHPEGVDQYYLEKILRLPEAHMAVSGFESTLIDRNEERKKLNIEADQVAYLYAAPARKFNRDSAKACIRILQQVPNSVLLYKGRGDHEVIRDIHTQTCNELGVDPNRVKFLPSYKTEEEHRGMYAIADVFLDSYPYNGGSHNLEVLWCNLPVVTLVGEQSFARMGYSFLQALDINEGIAHSWEEYIKWGVTYGLDTELRNSIKQKLILSKDPKNLAPLWNPKKFAQDMYSILQTLLSRKAEAV